jgi:hypothetical protein
MLIVSLSAGNIFSQIINYAEYFFDTDPGVRGAGTTEITSIIMSGDSVVKNFDFDVSSLGAGYHRLNIRVQDDLGRWSIVKSYKFYIYDDTYADLTIPPADISGFEYLFDNDTGAGTGTWISATMTADSAVKEADIPTTGLTPGYHKIITRARDADGIWSTSFARKFYVYDTTYKSLVKEPPKIVAAEYFFDKDNIAQGQGTSLSITPGDSVKWTGNVSVDGLESGDHVLFIRVKDSTGLWSISHAQPFNVVDLTTETNSPICQGSADGKAKVTVEGGTPPFTFLWDDPFQQTADSATGLSPGIYTVTVTDAKGAILKELVTITQYDTIQINITTSDTECNEANGSATAIATGENPPFEYLWTSGSEEQSASELRSGVHVVTVTDFKGCTNTGIATINDIGGPEITVKAIQHLKCAGDADGIIDISVAGGTPPYIYSWSNGEITQDMMNLKAGTYEIIVTDANGCLAAKSIRVEAPQPLTFALSVNTSDCGLTTGSATVSVSGGTIPYYYVWEGFPSPHSATRENLGAGVYSVTVTDKNSCSAIARIAVSEDGAPAVNITSVIQSTCGNTDGQILISVAGGTGSYTYNWKKEGVSVSTSKNLTGVGPGEYNLVVSDGSGCMTYAAATIPAELPPAQQICLVTVDTVSNKNLVVWTKNAGLGIVSYKIYRETTSAGVFDLVATRPYDSLSSFIDTLADPLVRSWRYKISAVDGCGNESRLSAPHKTMHLTINLGIVNSFNLIWNHYEGFVPYNSSYNIWRWSNGTWTMIDVVPSINNSYTDYTAPEGLLWYYVEAVHPTGCTPTKAGTLNSSRSNRQSRLKYGEGIDNPFVNLYNLRIYPNPSDGIFNLSMENLRSEDLDVKVYDLTGRMVYINQLSGQRDKLEFQIDLSGCAKGIYHLYLKTDQGIFNRLLIIE